MNATLRFVALIVIVAFLSPTAALAVPPDETPPEPAVERSLMRRVADGAVTGLIATFDILILRPTSFGLLAIGVLAFAPATVLSAPGGMDNVKTSVDVFILEPGRYVFLRPVGDF